jgi:rhodanese-related sulfurtransferase
MHYRNGTGTQAKGIGSIMLLVLLACTLTACTKSMTMEELQQAITAGDTAPDNEERLLVVDVRDSKSFIEGHIKDALSVPLSMIAQNGQPLYTNGYDEVSPTAATGIASSWLAHMLINQLVNDFSSTYENSQIVFYGASTADGMEAARLAQSVGYKNVSFLDGDYASWNGKYSDLTKKFYDGVESVDEGTGSFIINGYINNTNYQNVTTYGTHNCIIFEGGASHNNGMFQALIAPFCFQELLTYLGASPEGNMADGIDFGPAEEWSEKLVNGQRVDYGITWEGAGEYYPLEDLMEEKPSAYQPDPAAFIAKGIEPRIGGTRDSNVNWNPGCIYCSYSCVCGITSNARVNDNTWYADGGIYDLENKPDDPRNYYAGRFYPRTDILPAEGKPIQIKVTILK